jgi:hypothetical protein
MILPALLVMGVAGLLGSASVLCFWRRGDLRRSDLLLVISLGQGLGLGATSVLFFCSSLVSSQPQRICGSMEALVAAFLAWRLWRSRRVPILAVQPTADRWRGVMPSWLLVTAFAQAAVVSLAVAARTYFRSPHGDWDGWAIWSMHARFLWLAGPDWPKAMGQPSLDWSHPDYPLLISASVARGWAYLGRDVPIVPGIISVLFAGATVGLLVGVVARLRGWNAALIGGLVLMGTPLFLRYAGLELADIPVGFFMLAATSLLVLGGDGAGNARTLVLAGISAGLAAWTKNEGLMFFVLALLVYGGFQFARGRPGNFGILVAAAFIALLPTVYFKCMIASSNDIVGGQGWGTVDKLFIASRHRMILSAVWREAGAFGEWQFCPLVAMGLYLVGPGWPRWIRTEWVAPAILLLMAAGYYGVYLVTPNDLSWHLESSLNRLLLQLWPLAVFVWCLAAPTRKATDDLPGGAPQAVRGWRSAGGWVLANILLATVLLGLIFRRRI